MKAILMSIRPQYVAKILNGEKTIEIRKKFPKDYFGWVYIYCTKEQGLARLNNGGLKNRYMCEKEITEKWFKQMCSGYDGKGKVVARFWCDKMEEIAKEDYYPSDDLMSATMWYEFHTKTMDEEQILEKSCLRKSELHNYLNLKRGFAIHITKLEIFDKPKEISEFYGTKQYFVGCDNAIDNTPRYTPLTRAPQSWCYVEI